MTTQEQHLFLTFMIFMNVIDWCILFFIHLYTKLSMKPTISNYTFIRDFVTCISNVASFVDIWTNPAWSTWMRASFECLRYVLIVSLLDFLNFTFSIVNSNLCLLAVAFLTLPSGSKSKVAGLVNVDKHVCRLLALRHLGVNVIEAPLL